jgi:hypothetical protein
VPLLYLPHRLEARSYVVADCERRFVVESIVPAQAP